MYNAIEANRRKSVLLIALVVGLVSAAGYAYGQTTGAGWSGLVFALLFSAFGTAFTWFAGDTIALSTAGAVRVEQKEQAPELWNTLENLSITAGLPMPKLYLIEDGSPNAFATGRDPEHASIAVTSGLVQTLSRTEIEGVLAHELSHIQNYDTRWMVLVGVLVGSLSLLGDLFFRLGGSKRRESSNNGGQIGMIIGIAFLVLAPIIGQLIRLAISRKREYLADASAALLTRYPEGLASALEKISHATDPLDHAPDATAHLWIASPLQTGQAPGLLSRLFSTHPPIEDRISILRSMIR